MLYIAIKNIGVNLIKIVGMKHVLPNMFTKRMRIILCINNKCAGTYFQEDVGLHDWQHSR